MKGIEAAGSNIFSVTKKTLSQIPLDATEDFAIPVSLQKYLVSKSRDVSSMQVLEMTNEFKKQYKNINNEKPEDPSAKDSAMSGITKSASEIGELSPYSGGSIGGALGGVFDVKD